MSKLKEKGITLLSLIVTVVILLILVGVTIGQITGNKGLFNRVRKTVSQYENTQEQEDAGMVELETMLEEEREKEEEEELQPTTANPKDVLRGQTYYTGDKIFSTGSMPNNGTINETIEPGKSITLEEGYYKGGTITAKEVEQKTGTLKRVDIVEERYSGGQIDVMRILPDKYKELTTDNFAVIADSYSLVLQNLSKANGGLEKQITYSYDANTGYLTIDGCLGGALSEVRLCYLGLG